MVTLSVSDFDKQIDAVKPGIKNKEVFLLDLVCNTALFRYIIFKRVMYLHGKTFKTLDSTIKSFQNKEITLGNPAEFRTHIKELIHEYVDIVDDDNMKNYFTVNQSKKMKTIVSNVIKKMIKLESIAIREDNKNKPKVDDSHLLSLVMNNNSLELQKQMSH